ncbi:MAG: DUF3047 domain-containing protein [Geobacteraceae bacterium]|nr:DUF3047 domain-containing protein [Geobacteraceae bacterium]
MKTLLFFLLVLVGIQAEASDNELHLGRFSSGDLTGWKEQTIGILKHKTSYSLSKDNGRTVLVARSTKSASGRIYALNLDPKEYQTLKWSWKIDHTIKKGDEKSKKGDDFAARLCVFFPHGFFSKTPAICYVWANKLLKGEHVANPFTANIITLAADSGEELAGRWTFHQRNILEDYRRFFGEEPPRIGAVALMTDTDNTGESAIGYYGDISFIRSPKIDNDKQKDQKVLETTHNVSKLKDQPAKTMENGKSNLSSSGNAQPKKANDASLHSESNSR